MKKILIQIYAYFVITVMLTTICIFVFKIFQDAEKGKVNANITFGKFARVLISEAGRSEFLSDRYKSAITKYARQLDIKSFTISSEEGNLISYPHDYKADSSDKKIQSIFVKNFSGRISVNFNDREQPVLLQSEINIVSPEIIFIRSRSVFIVALTVFLITVIFLISCHIQPSERKIYAHMNAEEEIEEEEPQELSGGAAGKNYADDYKTQESGIDEINSSTGMESLDELNNLNIYKNYDEFETDFNSFEKYGNTNTRENINEDTYNEREFAENKIYEKISVPHENFPVNPVNNEIINSMAVPEGLYSPLTGLGWQQYLPERLDAEIGRAASSDQDISFMIIKLKNTGFKNLNLSRISELLRDIFKFRDMVFEYGEDGFAGILQDSSLEEAMRISNDIYEGLQSELEFQAPNYLIAIGMTSRAYRLIPASRMIEEAEAALKKAEENNGDPIVAFRANSDKYRNFIANNKDKGAPSLM